MKLSGVKPDPRQQSNSLPRWGGFRGPFGQALFLMARGSVVFGRKKAQRGNNRQGLKFNRWCLVMATWR